MNKNWAGRLVSIALGISISWHAMAATQVTVFAAASLTDALQNIADVYQREKGVKIVISFASSSTLVRQLEQGAPVDIFISADRQWMDYAMKKNLIDKGTHHILLGNTLVLAAAQRSCQKPVVINQQTDWKRLLGGQRLAVGDPDHVPAGIYAKQALQNLGNWSTAEPLLAPANSDRAALMLVERGETPYGIVYGSDVAASRKVTVVGHFPSASHEAIEYPMAVVKNHNSAAVLAFCAYLQSAAAASVFKSYGFIPYL